MIPVATVRLKNVASLNDEQLDEHTDPDYLFEYVDVGAVGRGHLVDQPDKVTFAEAPTRARRLVKTGDTIVSTVRTYLRAILPIGPELNDVVVSTGFAVVRPRPAINPRFLAWSLQGDPFVEQVVARSTGVSYPAIAPSTMAEITLTVPVERKDQKLIADFLDQETHRIDALVDAKRRMIDLLDEKLTSSITRLVTKGTDRSASLAPSGIDWVGDVPAHWSIEPVGARYRLQLGKMLNREAAEGSNQLAYLRNVNVQWWDVNLSDVATMSFNEAERAKFRLQPGDLLVCEGGEVGRAAIWKGELDECLFQKAIHRLRPRYDDDPQFLAYVLYAASSMEVFRIEGNQSTIVHLTGEQLRAHRIAFPPPNEQRRIVASLDRTRQRITTAISALESQLELLAEFRQALITQAVTGQLDESALKGVGPVDGAVGVIPE